VLHFHLTDPIDIVYSQRATGSKFIKNYDFDYPQTKAHFTMTAVAGHLMGTDFEDTFSNWTSCDPFVLFDAPVRHFVLSNCQDIQKNLNNEAKRADMLMIWTDCDREGEHIGREIANVCKKSKPNIIVKRARFSAIIAQYVLFSLTRVRCS
jgi:DNA topoisomerase-3